MNFTEEQIKSAWEMAQKVNGFDASKYRKDACGAWIAWEKYGVADNIYGWVIDHIYPKSKGGDENPQNLRAFHYKNNQSKKDDYPSYYSQVTSEGNRNKLERQVYTVNHDKQEVLKKLYNI